MLGFVGEDELSLVLQWLDDVELTYTHGPTNLNWKNIMKTIKEDKRFYFETDEFGERKDVGWDFLKVNHCSAPARLP